LVFIKLLKDSPEVNFSRLREVPALPGCREPAKTDFTPSGLVKTAVMRDSLKRRRDPHVVAFFCARFSTAPGKPRSARP
jgi:hypothetical protein